MLNPVSLINAIIITIIFHPVFFLSGPLNLANKISNQFFFLREPGVICFYYLPYSKTACETLTIWSQTSLVRKIQPCKFLLKAALIMICVRAIWLILQMSSLMLIYVSNHFCHAQLNV